MKIGLPNLLVRSNRKKTAFEVEEELQFHIEMLEDKYIRHGMSTADAKAAALRRFGNLQRVKKQCVDISRRNSLLLRLLKTLSILIGLTGLAIHILSSDLKVAHIGDTLILIAISVRLLIYVRGLGPSTVLPATKERSISIFTDTPEDGAQTSERPECW